MNSQLDIVCGADPNAMQSLPRSLTLAAGAIEQENARLRLAIRELRHRACNQWQFLMGMAELERMQFAQAASTDGSTRLRSLIYAFAALNKTLDVDIEVLNGSHKIAVRPVLEGLLTRLQATAAEGHLAYSVEDAFLTEKGCASLLLICAELICNAAKYGKKSTYVTFCAEADRGILEVRDDGPGFPVGFRIEEQSRQGLLLVDSLCRFDLNGEIHCRNDMSGGVVTVIFPTLTGPESATAKAAGEEYNDLCAMEGIICFDELPE